MAHGPLNSITLVGFEALDIYHGLIPKWLEHLATKSDIVTKSPALGFTNFTQLISIDFPNPASSLK